MICRAAGWPIEREKEIVACLFSTLCPQNDFGSISHVDGSTTLKTKPQRAFISIQLVSLAAFRSLEEVIKNNNQFCVVKLWMKKNLFVIFFRFLDKFSFFFVSFPLAVALLCA
jgi:hypothetical protein